MKNIINAVVSVFFTREKFCRARSLDEVTRDWRELELVGRVAENHGDGESELPEGFGYFLAGGRSEEPEIVEEITPFNSPEGLFYRETLQRHFQPAA